MGCVSTWFVNTLIVWTVLRVTRHDLYQSTSTDAHHRHNKRHYSFPELFYAKGNVHLFVDLSVADDIATCTIQEMREQKYRRLDGSCNHRSNMGTAHQPVKRYLKPQYQDRFQYEAPRTYSLHGVPLPSAREVSWRLSPDRSFPDKHTMLVMQLGQLIDHDITSAIVPTETDKTIKCCGVPRREMPEECFPIEIPKGDPFFKDGSCMEFVRSEPAKKKNGRMQYPREQINALSSFLDGSAFYGNDHDTLNRLRDKDGKGALMKTILVNGRERLPRNEDSDCIETPRTAHSYCQLAGDLRVNEQPCLGAVHTMFHLEHNRIARMLVAAILKKRRKDSSKEAVERAIERASDRDAEKLFQEAKKILGGIWQKIVYCDWLKLVLGPALHNKYQLSCRAPNRYNRFVDPRIANGFLGAAFRFGHSQIPNIISLGSKNVELRTQFMKPDSCLLYYENIVEGLLHGQSQETFDRFISSSVSRHLFETTGNPPLDLISLNIQRGRDHGLPAYYYWRMFYRLKKLRDFSNFGEDGNILRKIYRDVKDIDLFAGGLLEKPVPGGIVGPTFGNIIGNQFADLKFGDAFFFLRYNSPQAFTPEQRQAILDVDIKSVICAQSDMTKIQENPYLEHNSKSNPYVLCKDVPSINLKPWLDELW